jgi:hypothetical protein
MIAAIFDPKGNAAYFGPNPREVFVNRPQYPLPDLLCLILKSAAALAALTASLLVAGALPRIR